MPLAGYTFSNPKDLLSGEEVERIHRATLDVLGRVGVVFADDSALEVLGRAGCALDRAGGRVRFPGRLVEECIGLCPSEFTIRARHSTCDLRVEANRLYFQSHPGLYLLDPETGERRQARLADVGPLVRLLDSLDEIHLAIMPVGTVADKPPPVVVEWITAEVMRNTRKVTAGGAFAGCTPWVIEMAAITAQQIYGQMNSVTPLLYSQEQILGGLDYVRAGHPICILPGPTLGANSPATLVGSLVLQNAEHLAGVVLTQLVRPGAPVTLASYPHVLDMRNGSPCIGGVEVALMGAALAQIGRRYCIPVHPEFPITDSKVMDEQAAFEKAMALAVLAEAGANLISNGGALETEKLWSPLQLIIDNEMNAMVGRLLQGIAVTDETLAVDAIAEATLSGSFLKSRHTRKMWKQEQFLPTLADRQSYTGWMAQGRKEITDRARERMGDLLRSHHVPELPEDQDRELARVVQAAERAKLG